MKANLVNKHEELSQCEVVVFPRTGRLETSKKEEGYTKMPNSLIDNQIMAQLNDKAFKCLMFIVRQTLGFDRTFHTIAITQFQKYCGIRKRDTVMGCIKELENKKLIEVKRKSGCLNEYSINNNPSLERVLPVKQTPPVKSNESRTAKWDGTSPIKRDSNKEIFKETFKENINEIFEFWKTTFAKTDKVILTEKRKSKIQARLKEGYSVQDIRVAIVNCSKSKYHIDQGYTDIELICREPEKLDRFLGMNTLNQITGVQPNLDSRNVNQIWEQMPTYYEPVESIELEEWMV